MATPRITSEDYDKITAAVGLQGEEGLSVVQHKIRGRWYRSIHIFQREPSTKEVSQFENTASRLKFRGNKAEVEGSQILAATQLYDKLIDRVYDLPKGSKPMILGEGTPLSRSMAIESVPALVKREAIRDFTGEVYSASRLAEDEEDEAPAKDGD